MWCLLCIASELGHRRSCHCTEAVEHLPFSVSVESQAPIVALLLVVFCLRSFLIAVEIFCSSRLSLPAERIRLLEAERLRRDVLDL